MIIRSAMLATALGAAALAAPASAQSATAVKYADLDLTSDKGRATLERRIDAAARDACGVGAVRSGTRMESDSARRCYTEALASVHKQVAEAVAKSGGAAG